MYATGKYIHLYQCCRFVSCEICSQEVNLVCVLAGGIDFCTPFLIESALINNRTKLNWY